MRENGQNGKILRLWYISEKKILRTGNILKK